jgi:ABC-type cobalamin/Fe3+-siderophores transport system ATPase subunit
VSLLSLHGVSKTVTAGDREHRVLRDVEFELERGDYAVVWGLRGSGRSTLLRIAAGIEPPDEGTVSFEGVKLKGSAGEALGRGIGYCHLHFGSGEGRGGLDAVMMGLLARGVSPAHARARAEAALERCGAIGCRHVPMTGLERSDAVRVALARTVAQEPRLIVVDEPTHGVELIQRDGILLLLRALTGEGIAVLASTGEPTGLSGANRTLALSEGRLRGSLAPAELGEVVALHGQGRRRAAG